jgi:ubiquinone/menaquinone biosynthesis C-methylase UbiE
MPTRANARAHPSGRPGFGLDVRRNLRSWERSAASYERRFDRTLRKAGGLSWGLWRIPEAKLRILGPVRGKDVLELGCGAASWSVGLRRRGARVTGLDVSPRRLAQAREAMRRAGVDFPLLEASAEAVPLPDRSFDIVFCDWGAMTFCDPYRTVPEAARLLRPGGVFAFSTWSVFRSVVFNARTDRIGRRLRNPYFQLYRVRYPDSVEYQLPISEWVRLFRENGFTVERLVETRPPPRATSRYLRRQEEQWARRWPLEVIWGLRRDGPA